MSIRIDGHTHIASTRFTPRSFFEGIVDNMVEQARLAPISLPRAKLMDRLLSLYQDHDGKQQLAEMSKLAIDQAVVLLPDFTYTLKDAELTIEEMYRAHADIVATSEGRMIVFAGVDPRWGTDGFNLFKKGIEEYGFRGLKLYPPCGYTPDSPLLAPYYEYCDEHRLPVLYHIGPTSPVLSFTPAHPAHVDEPARRYRNISFILAHGGANYQDDCAQLCRYRPNVYLDISGTQSYAVDASQTYKLTRLFQSGINHKIIFGTDWPINNRLSANQSLINIIVGGKDGGPSLTPDEAQLILGGNMQHILGRITLPGFSAASKTEAEEAATS